jgi:uncharacterized protein
MGDPYIADFVLEHAEIYVKEYMKNYDASHDYSHIQRVVALAHQIESSERVRNLRLVTSHHVVTLAALLHDIGDRKYLKEGEDAKTMVSSLLKSFKCPKDVADKVQLICTNVSYSNEMKNEAHVAELCKTIPELAIVQDADRLDAIGAVGIARMFTFTGAKENERGLSTEHFYEKLLLLEGRMKTQTGRELAKERTERMKVFLGWWADETGVKVGEHKLSNGH